MIGGSGFLGQEVTRQARLAGAGVGATFHSHALAIAGVDWRAVDIRRRDEVIARTSLIIGNGGSVHEANVHALASGTATGALFTDDVRCPVHVADLASALLELAGSAYSGIHHVAGADAVSRHELGVLIARRDGLDEASLPSRTGLPGALDLRLDCTMTQSRLTTRLRGAREFLGGSGNDECVQRATLR